MSVTLNWMQVVASMIASRMDRLSATQQMILKVGTSEDVVTAYSSYLAFQRV